MQKLRVIFLVSIFSVASFANTDADVPNPNTEATRTEEVVADTETASDTKVAIETNRAGRCSCNTFPGNFPGVGLFKYPERNWGTQASNLRLFSAPEVTDENLELALRNCERLFGVLKEEGVCSGSLLMNGKGETEHEEL